WGEPAIEPDHQSVVATLRDGIGHPRELRLVDGQRLLDEHRLARAQCVAREISVRAVTRENQYDIDALVRQHAPSVGGHAGEAVLLGGVRGRETALRHHFDELDVLASGEVRHDRARSVVATPDRRDANPASDRPTGRAWPAPV